MVAVQLDMIGCKSAAATATFTVKEKLHVDATGTWRCTWEGGSSGGGGGGGSFKPTHYDKNV